MLPLNSAPVIIQSYVLLSALCFSIENHGQPLQTIRHSVLSAMRQYSTGSFEIKNPKGFFA